MVVRVVVRLESVDGRSVQVLAIANAGFESDVPEIIIAPLVAERLGLYPRLPPETVVEEYIGAGGRRFEVYRVRMGIVKAYVVAGDRTVGPVDVAISIVPGERDVLLSDRAIDALGIVLIRPGEGLLRFIDDPEGTVRRSSGSSR
jgi:hypothetical protein